MLAKKPDVQVGAFFLAAICARNTVTTRQMQMGKLQAKFPWIFGLLGFGALGGYLVVRAEDKKLFKETFDDLGFPRTRADLDKWWSAARSKRIERYEELQDIAGRLYELDELAKVADRLRRCWWNIFDPGVDPQVAAWMMTEALSEWEKQFRFEVGEQVLGHIVLVEDIKNARAGTLDLSNYALRLVEVKR